MTAPALTGAPPAALGGGAALAARSAVDWWRIALVVVGALALAAGVAVVDGRPVGVFHDDSMYVILARSLATGQGYRYLNLPGAPPATHFPPGYPAFLALVSLVSPAFPASVTVFKLCNAVLLAVGAVLVARLARERFVPTGWAAGLGAATAVSVPVLVIGGLVLSEPLFFVLLVPLLVALERLAERPAEQSSGWRDALLLGAGIAACTLVRSHGVVLVPAAALVLVSRRRWRDAALVSLAAVACLLPWQLWSAYHADAVPAPLLGNYGSYAGWWMRGFRVDGFAMIPATLARTVPESLGLFAALFSPLRSAAAHVATLVALGALTAAGVWHVRRRAPVTLLFLAGYLAIVVLWPFAPMRFLCGVWPLLLLLPLAGAASAVAPSRLPSVARAALLTAFLWTTAGYAAYEVRAVRGQWWSSIARVATARIVPAVEYAAAHTAPSDVVAADDEGAVFLYTGRRAVPPMSFTTAQYLRAPDAAHNAAEGLGPMLEAFPIRTVLVGSRASLDAALLLTSASPPRLAPAGEFPGGMAFTVPAR